MTSDGAAIDTVLATCSQRGVAIAAHGVNAVASEAEARSLFAFAKRARVPVLSIAPDAEVLGALDALCAEHAEVRLAIHNHGPGMAWETIEEIEAALSERHPSFGACVDTGHFIRSGIDPTLALRRFGARVHGVHLKDFVSEGAFAEGCILGAGKLDLDAVFRALREIEFRGALSLEYERSPENVVPGLVACLRAASEAAERVSRS